MNQSRWERLSALYHTARDRPADARSAFLDQACDGDPEMRAEIESLLRHDLPSGPAFAIGGQQASPSGHVAPGTEIGIYRIESALGAGGMGEVHLATDTRLNRPVAVKFVSVAADPERSRRFQQEIRAVSSLNHPHILTVHDSGEFAGREYLVTEFVDGGTLKAWRDAAPRSWRQILDLLVGIADALATAHDSGILHRDVKPGNILVARNGYAKLADFGLAKLAGSEDQETRSEPRTGAGVVVGTLDYLSPERLSGAVVDRRSDVFSFGIVLYEMLSGRRPFAGETNLHVVEGILHQMPAPLPDDVPAPLREVVAKTLEKDPADRYQSMREVVVDLRRLVRQSTELPAAAASPNRRRRRPLAAALVALFVVAVGAAGWWWSDRLSSGTAQAITSIAVLPDPGSEVDPETEYGIIANIVDRLSQLADLKVIAHASVVPYKTRSADARTIGRELGVRGVLTVRLVRRDNRLAINLELADARDNSHIWGEQYNRPLADLLALQQEIPIDISNKLRLTLSGAAKQRLTRKYTESLDAYQLYVKGRYSWELWTPAGSKQAAGYCQDAINEDPDFALAYSCLADAYIFGDGVGLPVAEARRKAKAAAAKALELDPMLGEAHAASAYTLVEDWDFAGAEAAFKEAIKLSPSYAGSRHQYSHLLLLLGRFEESLAESKIYQELDPHSVSPIGHLGYHYLYAREYDEAIRWLQKDPASHRELGDAYAMKGMAKQAVDEYLKAAERRGTASDKIAALRNAFARSGMNGYLLKRIEQLQAEKTPDQNAVSIATLYARLGDKEQSFDWLEKAYATHAEGLVRLKEELAFDTLRPDARFKDLLRRVGLPQ